MKSFIRLFFLGLCSYCLADPGIPEKDLEYHRFYAGPDFFGDHVQIKYHSSDAKIDIKSNAIFAGIRGGYDYTKPKYFYFGSEALLAIGINLIKTNSTYKIEDSYSHQNKTFKSVPLFINIEQRFGYTIQSSLSPQSTITPFIGLGWYYNKLHVKNAYPNENWFYGTAGLRIMQQFSENMGIGFNVKAMCAFFGRNHVELNSEVFKENLASRWGYEMGIPVSFHVGETKKWDMEIQPYFLKLDTNTLSNILGVRLQISYLF